MPTFAVLAALFFASGACGLIYQVLWLRELSHVFGVTTHAASTVLAAFMGGLALGSALAERVAARTTRPLAAFGIVEILIGLSALATPFGLTAATTIYVSAARMWPDALAVLTVARFVGALIVLLVPTVLMGVTLPLLGSSSLVRGARFGSRLSLLYAANAGGAVTGSVAAGFHLIGGIGMSRTFLVAAAINMAVGVAALLLDRRVQPLAPEEPATPSASPSPTGGRSSRGHTAILVVAALSGLASLGLEIVWFRVLLQFLAATTYAFTTMVATVLAGIAVGGAIASRMLATPRNLHRMLATSLASTGAAVVVSLIFLSWSYSAGWRTAGMAQASVAAIFPAALLMGVSFPVILRLATIAFAASRADVARLVGRVYALNVAGAIVGALATGFFVIPLLGSRGALLALAALYLAASVLALGREHLFTRCARGSAIAAAIFIVAALNTPDPYLTAIARRHGADYRELWRDEGAQTAVSVQTDGAMRVMFLDGLHQANDSAGMIALHRRIGHLPMVLHPNPTRALVIGLGGGATAGAVSQYPGARVQVVELSDSVVKAAPFFSHVNYDVLTQPTVAVRRDDGRNFLLVNDERFDVITADIIQPEHAGAGNLYSREYFRLVRNALGHDGLALQWIGHRRADDYKLIMRTFLDAFPNATLWLDGTLLVGSKRPLRLDPLAVSRRRAEPATARALDDVGLVSDEVLRSWYTAGPNEMRRYVGAGPLLSDDRPLLEYHRSIRGTDESTVDSAPVRGNVSDIAD